MKKTVKWISGFTLLSLIMALSCVLIGNMEDFKEGADMLPVSAEPEEIEVIIDAGHGGEDGGCIGEDGTLEKDLNLSVALKVYEILKASGVNAVLTRSEDIMLYDMYSDLSDYSGVKKTYDLRNRVKFADESDARLFVSIHMNKFADPKYSGFQMYYSDNESDSITAALKIQSYVKEYLQSNNEREIKKATSSIYVLHRATLPAVLCECGFLSNSEELELLKSEEYQKRLSFCIAMSVIDSLGEFEE